MLKLENTYLGFTNDLKPLQKSRTENVLNKLIRYKNKDEISSQKEFILNRLIEGYTPHIEKNYSYYSDRIGGYIKPKTEYRLVSPEESYLVINKTLYNFANYILDNDFSNDTIRNNHIKDEIKQKEEEIRQQELQAQKERQEKEAQNQQEEEFNNWLESEAIKYNNNKNLTLTRQIFLDIINQYSEITAKKLLTLIDNIDDDKCKETLIDWLHTENKASRKVFECITGIKLPTPNKGTRELLLSLNKADYKCVIEYKPRKKTTRERIKNIL